VGTSTSCCDMFRGIAEQAGRSMMKDLL
jgi:hypothetical protein